MSGKRFERQLIKQVEEVGPEIKDRLTRVIPRQRFAEHMLMAIIKAHPLGNGKSDTERLSQALKALMGLRPSVRADNTLDEAALQEMAEIAHALEEGQKLSQDKLAELAAKRIYGEVRDATVKRLVGKWSDQRETLLESLRDESVAITVLHDAALEDLQEMLPQLGIAFEFDRYEPR